MNDPFWRGADGKQDTPASPSPGIAVLSSKPDLGKHTAHTWPIAAYQEVHNLDKIKEGVLGICNKHHRVFTGGHRSEWQQLLDNIPQQGPVSSDSQPLWHAKVHAEVCLMRQNLIQWSCLQVVTFLDGVKLPAFNQRLDDMQSTQAGASSSGFCAERPTATTAPLPMLNLTRTSRQRLGLVFENKKGKQKRQRQEEEERTVQHEDSDDPDVDGIGCQKCACTEYSLANPILLCDGEACGKGWHLECIINKREQRAAREALKNETEWYCSPQCPAYEFEQVIRSRIKNGDKEYLVKWKGCDKPSWEPEPNVPLEHRI